MHTVKKGLMHGMLIGKRIASLSHRAVLVHVIGGGAPYMGKVVFMLYQISELNSAYLHIDSFVHHLNCLVSLLFQEQIYRKGFPASKGENQNKVKATLASVQAGRFTPSHIKTPILCPPP